MKTSFACTPSPVSFGVCTAPQREELPGRPLSPSAAYWIEDLPSQRDVGLHHETCVERMCAWASGLVAYQFRKVHKIKVVLQRQRIRLFGRDVILKQSIELFKSRLVHPLWEISISNADEINENLTRNPTIDIRHRKPKVGKPESGWR